MCVNTPAEPKSKVGNLNLKASYLGAKGSTRKFQQRNLLQNLLDENCVCDCLAD